MKTNLYNLQIIENSSILIACSGGIDSIFLLRFLSNLKKKSNLTLFACYVDHKLRPESADETKFVNKICQELDVNFCPAAFDDNFWKDSKSNLEERARKERYRILSDIALANNCEYLATGHHQDDQVETLLMRIFDRGTGVKGLAGIKNVQDFGEIKIIRPLLHMSRSEIEKEMEGKEFLTDSSNNNTDIRRNYYRKKIIPSIEATLDSDEFKKHLYTLSQNAQRELEFTSVMAKDFWEQLTPYPLSLKQRGGINDLSSVTPYSLSLKQRGEVNDLSSVTPDQSLKQRGGINDFPNNSLNPSLKKRETRLPRFAKERAGGELFFLPRDIIEKYSDNFWLTAFSYLFAKYRDFSHSTETLIDIVAFIRKKEPATANYHPFVFVRSREGIKLG